MADEDHIGYAWASLKEQKTFNGAMRSQQHISPIFTCYKSNNGKKLNIKENYDVKTMEMMFLVKYKGKIYGYVKDSKNNTVLMERYTKKFQKNIKDAIVNH